MDFASRISVQEWWGGFGFLVLVVGLIGDIAVLAIPEHRGRLEKLLSAFFTCVIIVGCAFEHVADDRISVLVSQEEAAAGVNIAKANAQAADAVKQAADLGLRVENIHEWVFWKEVEAQQQLDGFKRYATDEKKKNGAVVAELNADRIHLDKARADAVASASAAVKTVEAANAALTKQRVDLAKVQSDLSDLSSRALVTEKRVEPRELKSDAAARVVAKVKPFGPVTFDVGIVAFDDTLFLQVLDSEVWPKCGWKNTGSVSPAAIPLVEGSKGIRVLYDHNQAAKLGGAATAFATALINEGIPSTVEAVDSDPRLNSANIHVFVGKR